MIPEKCQNRKKCFCFDY